MCVWHVPPLPDPPMATNEMSWSETTSTLVGERAFSVAPLPRHPPLPRPQVYTVPSEVTHALEQPPAATWITLPRPRAEEARAVGR